jgi:hypothetical protein
MKYLYHAPDDGSILLIAHQPEPANPNPYINIDDSLAEDFFAGRLPLHQFAVSPEGILKNLYPTAQEIETVSAADRIYALPKNTTEDVDFTLIQDKEKKLLTVQVSESAIKHAQGNRFANQSHCLLIACVPGDPNLIYWYQAIPVVELSQGTVVVDYLGEDNIQLYTNRIFKTYKHEQLN